MLEYITYEGKKYPIRISYYVLEMVSKEYDLAPDEIDKNVSAQKDIFWYSLISGHHMAKKELTLKREDCVWILDECYLDFQKALYKFGRAIIDMQKDILTEDENKKK